MLTTPDLSRMEGDTGPDRLEAARECVRAARYDDALGLLRDCEDWSVALSEQAILLKAEIYLRRDPVTSLELLARANDAFTTPGGRFGYYLASGKAHANCRDYEGAAAMFRSAEKLLPQGEANWLARLGYQKARLLWLTRKFDPQCAELVAALSDPSSNAQLLALSVRGWMHAGLEDYEAQIADLSAAIHIALAHPGECDTAAVAVGIHSLLRIGFELGDAQAVELGAAAYEALAWTPDVQVDRFQSVRALGWDAFLHGKSARAQWLFKDSKNLAPSAAWKVMAHVDRAYVARMNLNEIWATEELLQANTIARDIVWSATQGEERLALVTLAILFAPIDMGRAQHYVSTYMLMGTENINPTLALNNDRRGVGLERYASGRVHQVLGHNDLATTQLESAYKIFSETRHHHRASLAAIGLHEVTGDAHWLELARTHAGHFPHSPISERLTDDTAAVEQDVLYGLNGMQRQIALALREGLDIDELSRRFSRSTFTLSKQIALIYTAIGVNSRTELRTALEGRAS